MIIQSAFICKGNVCWKRSVVLGNSSMLQCPPELIMLFLLSSTKLVYLLPGQKYTRDPTYRNPTARHMQYARNILSSKTGEVRHSSVPWVL